MFVMPFGLSNAPATFNRMMDKIFRPHHYYTRVFFDDIVFYSKTLEEHKEHLKICIVTSSLARRVNSFCKIYVTLVT